MRPVARRWLAAAALVALVDFLWAIALTSIYGQPAMSVWKGVASVAFGPAMLTGGTRAILIGLAMHVGVASTWAGVFVLAHSRSPALRRVVATPAGALAVAAVYGPVIWIVMSAVLIPSMTGRALVLTSRWFIQLAGHAVFVGLPIVWGARSNAHSRAAALLLLAASTVGRTATAPLDPDTTFAVPFAVSITVHVDHAMEPFIARD